MLKKLTRTAKSMALYLVSGPGQGTAWSIRNMVCNLRGKGRTMDLVWVKGVRKDAGQQEGRRPGRSGSGETRVLQCHVYGSSETPNLGEVQEGQDGLACSPEPSWHRRDTTSPSEEVLPEQHAERAGSYSGADPYRSLEVRSLPQADPQDGGR
jgi:hypothetical protein